MSRTLQLVVVGIVAGALCAVAGSATASARRTAACDDDDGVMSLPVDLMRSPLLQAEARPASDEPRPAEARVCVAGATDDPSCRPHSSLPAQGHPVLSLLSATFLLASVPALPAMIARRCPRPQDVRLLLAAGFVPGVERPPRSLSISA